MGVLGLNGAVFSQNGLQCCMEWVDHIYGGDSVQALLPL